MGPRPSVRPDGPIFLVMIYDSLSTIEWVVSVESGPHRK
jgi:hypothetical protein